MPPLAVLFDFDGVIVDTENIHIAAWQRTLTRMGWELTDEAALHAAEVDDRVFLSELFKRRKIEGADLEGWLNRKQELAEAMLADGPRVYLGVVELVNKLQSKGVKLGIVTTTWRRNVEIVLNAAKLTEAFEVIVAKEDVAAMKPMPDGYQLALKRLGLKGDEAIAIEDSPTGVEAAKRAGLRVVAVGHRRLDGEWSGGNYLRDFLDLARAFGALDLS